MTSEQSIHERVWALYEAYGEPDAVMFHIPNGEKRDKRTAAKLKRMGVVAGAGEFFCAARNRVFILELKREKGRISDAQYEMASRLVKQGVTTLFAWSLAEAVAVLKELGVLRADLKFTVSGDAKAFVGAQDASEAKSSEASKSKFTSEAVTAV